MTKDLKIIILGRLLQIGITLLSMRLLTTYLSPEEVGNYYILLALIAFFNLVFLHPLGIYFNRHLLQWYQSKDLLNALGIFIIWMIIVALLAIGISFWAYGFFGYEEKFDLSIYLIYILGSILISTMHRTVLFGSNTLGFRKEFVIYLLLTLLLGLILSSTIVTFYYPHALGWVLGVLISELLIVTFIFKFFIQDNQWNLKKINLMLTREYLKKIIAFSLPIGITTFLMWGQTIAYRFLVDSYYSTEILAYIAVGLGVTASVFGSVESIAQQYFNPIFLKSILDTTQEKRVEAWNSIAQKVVPIYVFTAFFTLALAEVLITVLVDATFHDAYIYVMIGVILEFFRVMSNLLNNVAQAEYQTKAMIKPYLLGFIIVFGILSSTDFGGQYQMIPLVLGVAYLCVFISMYFNMKQILDIKYDVPWLKMALLSLPFGMIYFIDLHDSSIGFNIIVLVGFGCYYLLAIWVVMKNIDKNTVLLG